MQMKPIMVVALASLVLVPVAFADGGKGKGGSGTVGTPGLTSGDVRLIAKLTPAANPVPLFEGHAVRRTQGTSRDEFEARIEVPVSLLGSTDPTELADIHPDLVLASGAIHCTMVLDEVNTVTGVAEYKTSIRSRNGSVPLNRAGSCTPAGIPAVSEGTPVSVDIGGDTLKGTFVTKR